MATAAGFTLVSALPSCASSCSLQRTNFLSHTPLSHKNPSGGLLKLSRRSQAFRRINAVVKKWDPSKVVPQADRVLVRLEQLPEGFTLCCIAETERHSSHFVQKSAGGVLLPKAAVKFECNLVGEVLSVGAEVTNIDAGKKVLFFDINAYEVDLGTDTKHCFCRSGDLLALVE